MRAWIMGDVARLARAVDDQEQRVVAWMNIRVVIDPALVVQQQAVDCLPATGRSRPRA